MHKFTILACSLLKALFTGKDDTSIFGIIGNTQALFLFTLLTSILSASFGMANSLKLGVCRTMAREGPLDGLFTGKFIFLVLTCAGVLWTKGFMIAMCNGVDDTLIGSLGKRSIFMQTLAVFGLFIPQTLLAMFSTIGWSKASLKN